MKMVSPGNIWRKTIPAGKNAAWASGGAILVLVVSVAAQQAVPPSEEKCALKDAASEALNRKVKMIGLTSPDPSKYFTPGGAESCLGAISNIDLSGMIPDPFGILSDAAMTAIDAITKAAMSKVCTAVRSSFGETIGKYNSAIGTVAGFGGTNGLIDAQIGKEVESSMGQYGIRYNSVSGTSAANINNPLSSFKAAANPTASNVQSSVSLLQQNASNAGILTSAAGNMEISRLNLAREQQGASMAVSEQQKAAAAERVRAAEASYTSAQKTYQDATRQVNTPTSSGIAVSVQPATIGSSVF